MVNNDILIFIYHRYVHFIIRYNIVQWGNYSWAHSVYIVHKYVMKVISGANFPRSWRKMLKTKFSVYLSCLLYGTLRWLNSHVSHDMGGKWHLVCHDSQGITYWDNSLGWLYQSTWNTYKSIVYLPIYRYYSRGFRKGCCITSNRNIILKLCLRAILMSLLTALLHRIVPLVTPYWVTKSLFKEQQKNTLIKKKIISGEIVVFNVPKYAYSGLTSF